MAIPTLVQHVTTPNTTASAQSGATDPTSFTLQYPNASLVGNLLVISIAVNREKTFGAVTDDQGQTWTAGATHDDGTDYRIGLFYFPNTAAGVTKVTVALSGTLTAGSNAYLAGSAAEWYNVATSTPSAGSNHNGGTGTSWTAGAFTPSQDGCLVYAVGYVNNPNFGVDQVGSFTAMTSPAFDLEAADRFNNQCCESYVQPTAASINATITSGNSTTWLMVAQAFKSAAAGTAPTIVPRVVRLAHLNTLTETTRTFQFPTSVGNLVVIGWVEAEGAVLPKDFLSNYYNDWYLVPGSVVIYPAPPSAPIVALEMHYNPRHNPSRFHTITMSRGAGATSSDATAIEVIGASPTPFVQCFTSNGNEAVLSTWSAGSVTPKHAKALWFVIGDQNNGTILSLNVDPNGHLPLNLQSVWGGQDEGGVGGAGDKFTLDDMGAVFNSTDMTALTIKQTGTRPPAEWALAMMEIRSGPPDPGFTINQLAGQPSYPGVQTWPVAD